MYRRNSFSYRSERKKRRIRAVIGVVLTAAVIILSAIAFIIIKNNRDILFEKGNQPLPTKEPVPTVAPTATPTPTPTPVIYPEKDVAGLNIQKLGSILLVGDAAYQYYAFMKGATDHYIETIRTAAKRLEGIANVYNILIPTGMDIILPKSVRDEAGTGNQLEAMEYIYGGITDGTDVIPVPIYETLKEHCDEYIYFRTDHHWTALGAYYAYVQFAKAAGFEPESITDYESVTFPDFLGSFYTESKKNKNLKANPDDVIAYYPNAQATLRFTEKNGNVMDWFVISDVSKWKPGTKYSTFIGGDNPYTVIENQEMEEGPSIVVLKESFGNAFVPFLVDHYKTVYVIDYRYYQGEFKSFIEEKGVRDVLFLNNMLMTGTQTLIDSLNKVVTR
ncbi:MAG: hypothetical protein E7256_06985 [Lachnospiraceae bacterium]|nr:hypothetical protein [Lachnospiraceae bacterium]